MKIGRICLVALVLLSFGCRTDQRNPIPSMPVYLDINMTVDAPELNAYGGFKTFITPTTVMQRLGYGGILLVRTFEDNLCAYDLACPNEVSASVLVVPNNAGQARCDSCGSTFDIGYGTGFTTSGPSRYALKPYVANWNRATGNIVVTQ